MADAIGLALTSGNAWSSFEPTMMRTGTFTSARLAFVITGPSTGAIANAALIQTSGEFSIREGSFRGQVAVWLYWLAGTKALPLLMRKPGATRCQRGIPTQREPCDSDSRWVYVSTKLWVGQQLVDEDRNIPRPFPPQHEPLKLV